MLQAVSRKFDAALGGLDRVLAVLTVATLVVLIVVVFGAVVMRYLFNAPLIFSFDLSTLLFAWVVFIGLTIADHDDAHMGLDMVGRIGNAAIRQALVALRLVLVLALSVYLAYVGWQLYQRTGAQISSLRISARWLYLSMPVGFGLLALSYVGRIIRLAAGGAR
ncbi:TRAP transporter small permease [Aureimonas fodinaquatilis]|uniref:TRAP transporter small permease protein n=1 Tax=Aureimonas fodinaquatilis TaxID=2565783 RepID=A0A5B0DZV4_9HYPH|nr:TRAP transporter small permease [Aureimonas fodinaquatilis]KAA0971976.1 TRAP transporter small permease [Aureimonas fodinaquatilis]